MEECIIINDYMVRLKKKDKLYYARILPPVEIYEVCELIIRTVKDTWFVGVDKRDKRAYLFSYNDIDKDIFFDRSFALSKVLNAENNAPVINKEVDINNE